MRVVPLVLRTSLFIGVGFCFCMPKHVSSQDLCFWDDARGNLRDLSSMCGKNSDSQSKIKATTNNSQDGNRNKTTLKVLGDHSKDEKGGHKHRLNFVPDGSPSVIVRGNQEYHTPDGFVFRGNGMMTTPEGINIQMIVQDGKIVGQQYYRRDGSKLMPGETITTESGISFKQRKF